MFPAHLMTPSKASRILPAGSSADREATLESSSQAPVACSASVCEIRLAMNLELSEFFLDQTLTARLKYPLKTQPQEGNWVSRGRKERNQDRLRGLSWRDLPEVLALAAEQTQQAPGQPLGGVRVAPGRVELDLAEQHLVQALQGLVLHRGLRVQHGRDDAQQPGLLHLGTLWSDLEGRGEEMLGAGPWWSPPSTRRRRLETHGQQLPQTLQGLLLDGDGGVPAAVRQRRQVV